MTDENRPSADIASLMEKLALDGVQSFAERAEALHGLKQMQSEQGFFPYDRYTEWGSAAEANVITEFTGRGQQCILWCLNHYLGLNRNPRVIEKVREAVSRYGTGSGTSAVSGGMNSLHKQMEHRLAAMLGKQKAVVFPTGYTANLGALSALPGRRDLLLLDSEAHASIIDGARLSGRRYLTFRHNDVEDLKAMLAKVQPDHDNVFVVVESAYSMSGDLAPLAEIVALKRAHPFYLYVDEAHTFGFYGEGGRGYCHQLGLTGEVDFIMTTLSKATASLGGVVAAQASFCTALQLQARSYLFQACLSPADAAAVLACLDEIEAHPELSATLHRSTARVRGKLSALGFDLGTSQSPIIPIYIDDAEKLQRLAADLYSEGIFSVAVVFPAVKMNEGRLRFITNASHTDVEIDRTVETLERLGRHHGII